ncbi:MAG: hypothetical protein IPN76_21980 [Saprospiraceae bacterium]|nr:hypothetical protein [Saprospiraceae bacterium]
MPLPYFELHYASTQQSLLTGADGFGVRTLSEGLPKEIVEHLKSRNIFVYQAGSKALAGIFDLLQNPNLVMEYPETFALFREDVAEEVFYVFTRTVFLGRDYGWYLKTREESARSGNLFCHAVFFKEIDFLQSNPAQVFQALSTDTFVPRNLHNDPENEELRHLLTNQFGVPSLLPVKNCIACDYPTSINIAGAEETVLAVYDALETQRRVVVVLPSNQTSQHLLALLSSLPKFVIRSVSFATNNHEFNLYTDYTVLFVNEFYQRDIPTDHPYLLVCNYLTGQFPSRKMSDFSAHVQRLMQSGNLAELQIMNEGLNSMAAEFDEGMLFNQLFYAWVHLLTDKKGYEYNPVAVIRKVKEYNLTFTFRNRLNEYVLFSFKEALQDKQHEKVASSLQLLAETKLEDWRSEDAKRQFSTYLFSDDNAAYLFQYTKDIQLMLDTLFLAGNEAEIFSFLGRSSLPSPAMELFILMFCQKMSPESIGNILYSAALSNKIAPGFGSRLRDAWGNDKYQSFLLEHHFFNDMGEQLQILNFGEDTQQYLQDLALRGGDVVKVLRDEIQRNTFFHRYLDNLIQQAAINNKLPYSYIVGLFDYYPELVSDGIRRYEPAQNFETLLEIVLNRFDSDCGDACIENLKRSLRKLSGIIAQEKNPLDGKKPSEAFLRRLDIYFEVSKFMSAVLIHRHDVDEFASIGLPRLFREGVSRGYFRFMLAALPIGAWSKVNSSLKLCRLFFSLPGIHIVKHTFLKEELDTVIFIPTFYSHQLSGQGQEIFLIDFYKAYTEAIWSLRRNSNKDAQDPAKVYTPGQLCERIANYLNRLKDVDKAACKEVVEYIVNQMPDNDTDLVEYLQSKVQLDNPIKSLFKRFSPFKKD